MNDEGYIRLKWRLAAVDSEEKMFLITLGPQPVFEGRVLDAEDGTPVPLRVAAALGQMVAHAMRLNDRFERNAMRAAMVERGMPLDDAEQEKLDIFMQDFKEVGRTLLDSGKLPWHGKLKVGNFEPDPDEVEGTGTIIAPLQSQEEN